MKFAVAVFVFVSLAWAAPAAAQPPKKIQCWTDKSGQRMCGDRVPPEYAGQKRDVIKDGRVVDSVKAARTPEEIAAEKKAKQEAEDAKRRADYDRALLETYRTAKDIESMRDERILMLDGRIASIEKNQANTDKQLIDLKARAEKLTNEGKPVDERLAKQIKQFERDQKINTKSLDRNRLERAEIERKFNADLERYLELRGMPKPKPAAPVTAGAAATPTPTPLAPAPAPAPAAVEPAKPVAAEPAKPAATPKG
jgi:hypothetical protein